jgi:hypothetical protein
MSLLPAFVYWARGGNCVELLSLTEPTGETALMRIHTDAHTPAFGRSPKDYTTKSTKDAKGGTDCVAQREVFLLCDLHGVGSDAACHENKIRRLCSTGKAEAPGRRLEVTDGRD